MPQTLNTNNARNSSPFVLLLYASFAFSNERSKPAKDGSFAGEDGSAEREESAHFVRIRSSVTSAAVGFCLCVYELIKATLCFGEP